jgi:CheY-like chemotaxis protein
MPELDGCSFARHARRAGCTARLVVVSASPDAVRDAQSIGADGVIAKPFSLEDLLAIVERVLAA